MSISSYDRGNAIVRVVSGTFLGGTHGEEFSGVAQGESGRDRCQCSGAYLINSQGQKRADPSGLKANFSSLSMSELKLRPPNRHLGDGLQ